MPNTNHFLKVRKSRGLRGEVRMPRSKTHSFRALILASLADGTSFVRNPKLSGDWHEAVKAMRMYGAKIEETEPGVFRVEGVGGRLQTPADIINVNNSGTMLFFVAGVAAACPGWSVITGDESIRTLRKISSNLFEPFEELGVQLISTKNDGMAPLVIKGKVDGGVAHMDGVGCQPVFSVLLASAFSQKPVEIFVRNPGERAYIDLLLYWFRKVGLRYENVAHRYEHYIFPGNNPPQAFDVEIPLEWSAPAYPLLAAILTPASEITVRGMNWEDPYGDRQVIALLRDMGADITIDGDALTARTSELHGVEVDMNDLPDQVPTIAIAACFAKGKTVIKNALTARWKECDRIAAVRRELAKMGAKVIEKEDGLIIDQDGTWKLHAAQIDGYYDHRMVLSFALAAMQVEGETLISDAQMVEKSFENFIPDMINVGAQFELVEE
ncbi:MAG TPA: 3-phosphoshikimate 1-carboxyvinyltransferase [Ktedonobacteraceae bacterium]|nr:3-phosphoshikimate 1-carboxyvinyltransferase [Ktedonobacteraceae bacterium]